MKKDTYLDVYQKIMCALIVASFTMIIVLFFARLMVLDDLAKRNIVDSLSAINFAIQFFAWTWFIIRSVTYRMRVKENEDIEYPSTK